MPGMGHAERAEGRGLATGNTDEQNAPRTQRRAVGAPHALDRVRQRTHKRARRPRPLERRTSGTRATSADPSRRTPCPYSFSIALGVRSCKCSTPWALFRFSICAFEHVGASVVSATGGGHRERILVVEPGEQAELLRKELVSLREVLLPSKAVTVKARRTGRGPRRSRFAGAQTKPGAQRPGWLRVGRFSKRKGLLNVARLRWTGAIYVLEMERSEDRMAQQVIDVRRARR
jgi:hypothetical protein